eukprot:TRINITY_DN5614_c0_g1_i3.p1 TRINITY_DN5614_c0_g1~~TRINITY_DN5614_c0_g1_i3.p1  ORF type:complete len:478 (-),score=80.41 TRINITY_DN5614_c0_g1_i3:192-1625(-)
MFKEFKAQGHRYSSQSCDNVTEDTDDLFKRFKSSGKSRRSSLGVWKQFEADSGPRPSNAGCMSHDEVSVDMSALLRASEPLDISVSGAEDAPPVQTQAHPAAMMFEPLAPMARPAAVRARGSSSQKELESCSDRGCSLSLDTSVDVGALLRACNNAPDANEAQTSSFIDTSLHYSDCSLEEDLDTHLTAAASPLSSSRAPPRVPTSGQFADLKLLETRCAALQQQLSELRSNHVQLEDLQRKISLAVRLQMGTSTAEGGSGRRPSAVETRSPPAQSLPDLEAALVAARRDAASARERARLSHKRHLQQKKRRVLLQKQRSVRTCSITQATSRVVSLQLLAGLTLTVEQGKKRVAEDSLVTVGMAIVDWIAPEGPETRHPRQAALQKDLLRRVWHKAVEEHVLKHVQASTLLATTGQDMAKVPYSKLPDFLCELDSCAAHIDETLREQLVLRAQSTGPAISALTLQASGRGFGMKRIA